MNWSTVVWCCVAMIVAMTASAEATVSKDIIGFYDRMRQEYVQPSGKETAVIIVGKTGCGKSALAHYIAGDMRNLNSVPSSNNVDETNFLVEDLNEKISRGELSTVSKTIVPELIVDEVGDVWYDCPGFSDTRNTSVEITITYFLKSVTDRIQNIKMLFVTDYASVTKGMDRKNFDEMVNHGTKLIENMDKFNLSMGLVVTKVESFKVLRRKIIPITEDSVIDSVASFLKNYKKQFEESASSRNKRKLVDAFLRQSSNGSYTQIGVFWRPDDGGTFDQLSLMVDGRVALRNLVNERVSYVPVSMNDFGYALSEKAEIAIATARDELIADVSNSFKAIKSKIANFYMEQELKEGLLNEKIKILENAEGEFSKLIRRVSVKSSMPITTFDTLKRLALDLAIPNLSEEFSRIADDHNYLEFFQTVSATKIELSSPDWAIILRDCFDFLQQEKNWNIFLQELYVSLSSYAVQKDRTRYNVATVDEWEKSGRAQGIVINHENFDAFVAKQESIRHLLAGKVNVTSAKLIKLNSVLDVMLKQSVRVTCVDDRMIIKGTFVKSSDIDLSKCNSKPKKIHIFAIDTFFIDSNVDFNGKREELAVMAHKWEIVTGATFYLNGTSEQASPEAAFVTTLRNRNGKPGQPGLPGGNAAHFFGLFHEFKSTESNLTKLGINANGGAGGRGQHGSAAYSIDTQIRHLIENYDACSFELCSKVESSELVRSCRKYIDTDSVNKAQYLNAIVGKVNKEENSHVSYYIYPHCCSDGLAGSGGVGGQPGHIRLLGLNNKEASKSIDLNQKSGEVGPNGVNVLPCVSNRYTHTHRYKKERNYILFFISTGDTKECSISPRTFTESNQDCPNRNSYSSYNSAGLKTPSPQSHLDIFTPIIDYKTFLRENMNAANYFWSLKEFYEEIDHNEEMESEYDVYGYVKELQSYESHFLTHKVQIDKLPFYKGLLDRLDRFSHRNRQILTADDRKALLWLYTTVLSRQYALQMDHEPVLVTDIPNHFSVIISRIGVVNDLNKGKIIQNYTDSYQSEIDVKIKEAENFINQQILPTIDEHIGSIDEDIDGLVSEISKRKRQTLDDLEQLKADSERLKRDMGVRNLLGVVQMVGSIVSIFIPQSRLLQVGVTSLTALSHDVSDLKDQNGKTTPSHHAVLPAVKQDSINIFNLFPERTTQKINAVIGELTKLETNVKAGGAWSTGLAELINPIKAALETQKSSKTPDLKTINDLTQRSQTEISQSADDFMKRNDTKTAELLQDTSKVISLIQLSLETFQRLNKQNQDKINAVAGQIAASSAEYEFYRKREERIYTHLWPVIQAAHAKFADFETILTAAGQPKGNFVIAQWTITKELRSLQNELLNFVNGFDAEDSVVNLITDLKESFNMLFNILDRIQNYADQKKLSVYIGEVSKAGLKQSDIRDAKLNAAVTDLELSMTSNIILAQYHNAVNMFKLVVFPFAGTYLSEFTLPTDVRSQSNLVELAETAVRNLQQMHTKIVEFNSTGINQNDNEIHTGYFSGNPGELAAFYTWKRENHRKVIDDLLVGKKVFVRADATGSDVMNAVKFNEIGLRFRGVNQTVTDEIQSVLDEFHVRLNHTGLSHFRCDDHIYKVTGPSLSINFSFKQKNGEPVSKNSVYDKLKHGNIIVSPYALWSMQLEHGDFAKLTAFKGLVDLELHGHGQFILQNAKVCAGNLAKYYDLDEVDSLT